MPSQHHSPESDPVVSQIIRSKARRLRNVIGSSSGDLVDFEHDCLVELLSKLPGYRSEKGTLPAFAFRVLTNFVAKRLRARNARKRDPRRLRTLGSHDVAAGQKLDGSISGSDQEKAELQMDMSTVLAALPPDLRAAAEQLKHASISEAARRNEIPRTTLQSRVSKLRKWFERSDLRAFL